MGMSARSRTRAGWSPARRRFLAAAVAALLLVPHAAAADERDELDRTGRRLGAVESVLGDARAEATAVADAVAAADVAVGVARARLVAATGELAAARRRRADALAALEAASGEVDRQEARLAWQVRRAYMTGGVSGLAVVVQASDLRDLMERAVTLGYVIRADQDVLGRLERARPELPRPASQSDSERPLPAVIQAPSSVTVSMAIWPAPVAGIGPAWC